MNKVSSYNETIEWLFNQLPMYQNVGKSAYKKDLTNSIELDNYLNHPHFAYKTIHVAGTNGKGSTCHMLASVLQTAGYNVGLYTSPHLKDFRERIRINGEMISKEEITDFVADHKTYLEAHKLSFFEMSVGMAFLAFKNHKVDIAIIETGLGGRLDSTNIITPVLSIITSIDKDHVDLLGNTLVKIAGEKAGIIKNNIPVIINERRPSLRKLFKQFALRKNSSIRFSKNRLEPGSTSVNVQSQNENLVRLAAKILNDNNEFKVDDDSLDQGIANVQAKTGLNGRYQTIQSNPRVIIDVAHNPAGIGALIARIQKEEFNNLHIVFGMVKGKSPLKVVSLLPKTAFYYLCEPDSIRKLEVNELKHSFKKQGLESESFKTVRLALNEAILRAHKEDLIIVAGSTFVVAEIL
ncbi:bifunctional folylpolyglutamate synthase/dihydrofolate synthase [Nonlabens antarcticus]|uniref:bifunctional folylpolyglutamate synthase/dihydrofolate synthase n=1 Tax=Nonlabens antarcticus TaxID=392714 RepID=UPI00293BFF69|nr:folylpolyglutamate synthase/dihydrofolate synthase family protein [Nonlabens antarcticus]